MSKKYNIKKISNKLYFNLECTSVVELSIELYQYLDLRSYLRRISSTPTSTRILSRLSGSHEKTKTRMTDISKQQVLWPLDRPCWSQNGRVESLR